MKTCPVCGARSFDDAEVCYGCLFRFDDAGRQDARAQAGGAAPIEVPLQFVVTLSAVRDADGSTVWTCASEPGALRVQPEHIR